jgi:hypothetical protein
MTESEHRERHLADIPGAVVVRAQHDMDFATRLLHRDTRDEALNDPSLRLTEDERTELSSRLDDIATMSFQDAMERIRDAGVLCLG